MLAYVYGVVPISLCRGGGCGVSRGKGRGVRIDFDEDDGPITGEERDLVHQIWENDPPFHHLYCKEYSLSISAVADAWRALKSPSLGESSLDGAVSGLSTTSPSEGLSMAPGTLGDTPHFNTLAGGALGTRTGKYNRWENASVCSKQNDKGIRKKNNLVLSIDTTVLLMNTFVCSPPGWRCRPGSWPKNQPRGRQEAWGPGATVPAPAEWPDPSSRPTHYLTGDTLVFFCGVCVRLFLFFVSCQVADSSAALSDLIRMWRDWDNRIRTNLMTWRDLVLLSHL